MSTTAQIAIRELDSRSNDHIDVKLLWNPRTNRVSVAVEDERSGESFEFDVDGGDARDAFHHPYAYANHRSPTRSPWLPHLSTTGGVTEPDDDTTINQQA